MSEKARDKIWDQVMQLLGQNGEFRQKEIEVEVTDRHTRRTLNVLEDQGWLERDSEYGKKWKAGPKALEIMDISDEARDKIWYQAMELLAENGEFQRREIELKGVSDRYISQTLYVLEGKGWLQRVSRNPKTWEAGPKSSDIMAMSDEEKRKIFENMPNP